MNLFVDHYVRNYNLPGTWQYQEWNQVWNAKYLFDRFLVWFLPLEIATFTLETWVETPLTTSALFFIPCTVLAFWWGLSWHLIELATVYPSETWLLHPPLLPIPIIVLYLAGTHCCSLPDKDRLERTPDPANAVWHRAQKELLSGLPPGALSEYSDP